MPSCTTAFSVPSPRAGWLSKAMPIRNATSSGPVSNPRPMRQAATPMIAPMARAPMTVTMGSLAARKLTSRNSRPCRSSNAAPMRARSAPSSR